MSSTASEHTFVFRGASKDNTNQQMKSSPQQQRRHLFYVKPQQQQSRLSLQQSQNSQQQPQELQSPPLQHQMKQLHSPQQVKKVQSPQPAKHVQSPQQLRHVQSPPQQQKVQSPQQAKHVHSPQQQKVQSPQQAKHVHSPQQQQKVQSPQQAKHVQSPQQQQKVQSPQQAKHVQSPQQLRHVQSPQQQQKVLQPSPANDNKIEQTTGDKGVQVDWTVFAETDSHEIKSMFLLNMEDKECETAASKEIKMYRQREFNMLGHLTDYRKRTEDLKRKISLREMQLERLECALIRHKEMLVEAKGKERELQFLISDLRLTIGDLNEKHQEEAVLSKLRDAEHGELVDQLKKNIQKGSSKNARKISEKKSKTSSRTSHKSIDFLASTDEGMPLTQTTKVKLSASLGSISPTRKSFSIFTGRSDSRRRSDDNGITEEGQEFPFESESENEVPSDLSSSSDGFRHDSMMNRQLPPQRRHHSSRRSNGNEHESRKPSGNGKISTIHASRSPNISHHRRQEFQNLVPLQHSPQRHRGSSAITADERRNMLLSSLEQDFA